MFIAILVIALFFDFLNGFHDSSNIVATVIFSRALHPRVALVLAAIAEFTGPFLFGVAVARTIGNELLTDQALNELVVLSALIAAVLWNLITWYLGLPSSSSHALLGGLLGAAILYTQTFSVVKIDGLIKIVLALLLSPVAGLVMGFIVMRITLWTVRKATPRVSTVFRRLQVLTLVGLALSHGTNDAQKTMGVLTLALFLTGQIAVFHVPIWVIALSAGAIALGTAFGGWRLIRTLGGKIYRIRPIHGFTSQIAGASVILGSALFGGPVSTTQVLSSAIVGAGAAERVNKVRWTILRDMALAWTLTIPSTAIASILIFLLLRTVL
ncbi:MAG: anion permease [Anaerolineales bacterium]|jgi:PiT family inorganic phosphate transporter